MSSEVFDVVVIGGGIVGAACAAECAAEKLQVAIVEARMIGGDASGETLHSFRCRFTREVWFETPDGTQEPRFARWTVGESRTPI